MPVGLEALTMLRSLCPQWDGIWRPPEFGIVGGADRGEQLLGGGHAEAEAERAVAVVGVEPVVGRAEAPWRRPTSTASWPAPEIWKKILFCRLSWISLSSIRRDSSISR